MMNGLNNESTRSLFSGARSVDAIRSTGYKQTGNALGELVDNSIQAQATSIKIVVLVKQVKRVKRTRETIMRIAVIDNGTGMTMDELYMAVLFGQGTHFNEEGGLGKFGVGLPQASLSQCTNLKVWSWQNGFDNSYSTGYDLNDDNWREGGFIVSSVVDDPLPELWKKYVDKECPSGTIVQWSNLDRLSCSSASTLFQNSEFLIGRMYRYWINDNKVKIDYIAIDFDTGEEISNTPFRAVDPLYLMENTSDKDLGAPVYPMFKANAPVVKDIEYNGKKSRIIIKTSIAKEEILKLVNKQDQAGHKPYGKHAAKNVGLSIVREGRELELDSKWNGFQTSRRDPRERWWGAEISFGRDLDELFGVTNDKQSATSLSSAVYESYDDYKLDGESITETKERLAEEQPRLNIILDIAKEIRDLIKILTKNVPIEDESKGPKQPGDDTVEKKVTDKINKEIEKKGPQGESDKHQDVDLEEAKQEIKTSLENFGTSPVEIDKLLQGFVTTHYKVSFIKQAIPGLDAFFDVRSNAGLLIIILNTSHPLYKELFSSFEYVENGEDMPPKELAQKLEDTYDALKYLLVSWARYEDVSIKDGRTGPTRARSDWGRMARKLREDDIESDDDF
ncbi:hypothetical protein AR505_0887 [methanogenic archaeon ISO4-H5]|nr:hypothetical protein AR505_0887 [methanogenic archaeon ISO4-H5]